MLLLVVVLSAPGSCQEGWMMVLVGDAGHLWLV